MKYTIILCGLILSFMSCTNEASKTDPVIISGKIENVQAEIVSIIRDTMEYDIMVDDEGNFRDTLELDNGYYTLEHGREGTTIYLTPGDDLSVTLDTKKFDETISWDGIGAKENNYLAKKYLLNESMEGSFKELYSQDEESFVAEMESKRARLDSLLDASTELSDVFKTVEANSIKFQSLSDMYDFEGAHRYFTNDTDFEVSDDFTARFESIDYGSDALYKSVPSYKNLLLYKYVYTEDKLESLKNLSTLQSTAIKEDMVSMMSQIMGPGEENLKSMIETMKSITTNQEMIASLDEKYEALKNLQKGMTSPGFNFESVNGEMVALEDLKGKNVYIDVWATWCGPCKREIPFLKTLEGDYHDKNIEFVSISVDTPKDKQKWLDMVADKELKGIQLISDNGWSTSFVEEYLIKGIPRFILVDADGNIISADAPRPSSGEKIREMIDGLNVL